MQNTWPEFQKYKLPRVDALPPVTYFFDTTTTFERFEALKAEHNQRSAILAPLSVEEYRRAVFSTNYIGKDLKSAAVKKFNDDKISFAWLKLREILRQFPEILATGESNAQKPIKLTHADFCALPGGFILAAQKAAAEAGVNLEWSGTSYLGDGGLKDSYSLLAENPSRWDFGPSLDGDIRQVENIAHLTQDVNVDIATSDCGVGIDFESEEEYLERESFNMPIIFGAVVAQLGSLRAGGSLVAKLFTVYNPFTISMLYMLSNMFESAYIVKPIASKNINVESYFVGIGYRPISNLLLDKLMFIEYHFDPYKSMFGGIDREWLDSLYDICENLAGAHLAVIDQIMDNHRAGKNKPPQDISKFVSMYLRTSI